MDWRRLISSREALLFNERRLLFVFQPSNCHACYGRSGREPGNLGQALNRRFFG